VEDGQALKGDAFPIFFISLKEDQARSVEVGLTAGGVGVLKSKTAKNTKRSIEFTPPSFLF
jgi:hypothetical protein